MFQWKFSQHAGYIGCIELSIVIFTSLKHKMFSNIKISFYADFNNVIAKKLVFITYMGRKWYACGIDAPHNIVDISMLMCTSTIHILIVF